MTSLIKTNNLLTKLNNFKHGKTIEIEAYSCKNSKQQKKNNKLEKPLRFLISTLEMSFIDFDFSKNTIKDFKIVDSALLFKNLNYSFLTLSKNQQETAEYLEYLELLLNQCIDLKNSLIYRIEVVDKSAVEVFMLYNKKMRRILVIKISDENEE
ncbi:hypothetical protein NUSPORA_02064 [Nucleospora cyclopteri]